MKNGGKNKSVYNFGQCVYTVSVYIYIYIVEYNII